MRKGIIKSIIVALSCVFAMSAHAMANGFYMGLMMGPATNSAPSLLATKRYAPPNCGPTPGCPTPDANATVPPGTTIANPRSTQFATRIYLANQFNQYAAFEMGGVFFSGIRYDARGVPTFGSTDQRVRGLDAVMKGIFPLRSFNIYGKAGVIATYITSGGTFNPTFRGISLPNTPKTKFDVPTTYKKKFSPTFSIGASYDINQSWQVDGSYNTYPIGNNIGSLTFMALGISYHFTDKYCGQFLCDD